MGLLGTAVVCGTLAVPSESLGQAGRRSVLGPLWHRAAATGSARALKLTRAPCAAFPGIVTLLPAPLAPVPNPVPLRGRVKGAKCTALTLVSQRHPLQRPDFFVLDPEGAVKPEGVGRGGGRSRAWPGAPVPRVF